MTIQPPFREVTCVAPVNIAVIKYWGKRDVDLILPTNSSLSVTLNTDDLHSKTSARVSPEFSEDRFWLNDSEVDIAKNKRLMTCLRQLRAKRKVLEAEGVVKDKISQWKIQIKSVNNFPTAAGLASSASGLACFVVTIARLFELISEYSPAEAWQEISKIARQGSGSACRSVFGGYVKWEAGEMEDGADSKAVQVASKNHWPEMRAFVFVVNDKKKDVSSTAGMQSTVETSALFKHRVENVVPERIVSMEAAIKNRDFQEFADIAMRDSNQFHAVCLDTCPPIFYLNDTSKQIINFITSVNELAGRKLAAYTFDAGPNAVVFMLDKDVPEFTACVSALLDENDLNSVPCNFEREMFFADKPAYYSELERITSRTATGAIKRVIYTSVGSNPTCVQDSLFN